jgi:hypothetical protein
MNRTAVVSISIPNFVETRVIVLNDAILFTQDKGNRMLLKCPGKSIKAGGKQVPKHPVLFLKDALIKAERNNKRKSIFFLINQVGNFGTSISSLHR